jgi:hypothetical protein
LAPKSGAALGCAWEDPAPKRGAPAGAAEPAPNAGTPLAVLGPPPNWKVPGPDAAADGVDEPPKLKAPVDGVEIAAF